AAVGRWQPWSLAQQTVKGHEHSSGRAPDVMLTVRNVMDEHFGRAQHALAPLVIGGVENVQQRHLERRLDFAAIELQLEPRLHETDDGRYPEACEHEMRLEIAGKRHVLARQSDLLLRL